MKYIGDLERRLENDFLYNKDANSMNLLLTLIHSRRQTMNMEPNYELMKSILFGLRRTLYYRKDKEYILTGVKKVANDDIHRLELSIALEGYRDAQNYTEWIDRVERIALTVFSPKEINQRPFLFKGFTGEQVQLLRERFEQEIMSQSRLDRDLNKKIKDFFRYKISDKLGELNQYIDRQFVMDYENPSRLKEDGKNLSLGEINLIRQKMLQYTCQFAKQIYLDYLWYGINDAVLERYR